MKPMTRTGWIARWLPLLASCMFWAGCASAQVACEPDRTDAEDSDGARVRIETSCDADGQASYLLQRTGADGAVASLRVAADDIQLPRPAELFDLDEDGLHEAAVRTTCGAGANCASDIYRYDPGTRAWYHFYSGSWAGLSILDGHLIDAARANCCEWEFNAYPLPARPVAIDLDTVAYTIYVKTPETEGARVSCTFMREHDNRTEVVAPPGPAWLELCEHYGEPYHVVTPAEAAAGID